MSVRGGVHFHHQIRAAQDRSLGKDSDNAHAIMHFLDPPTGVHLRNNNADSATERTEYSTIQFSEII